MNPLLDIVLTDLAIEGGRLDETLTGLGAQSWQLPTPAVGWTIAHQIAHLSWTDDAVLAAATDQQAWDALVLEALGDPEGFVDTTAEAGAQADPADLLVRWRAGRSALAQVLRDYPEGERMPWYGPPMSATSMGTARFMETWAHSLDVYDALGIAPEVTDRIRHVAHLGVRTRGFAFSVHQIPPPGEEFRVELVAPSGELWTWGPEDAAQRVTGPAYDFCLLVTQRVHRDDTTLVATSGDADRWLDIAQCFAGPSGEGRPARG